MGRGKRRSRRESGSKGNLSSLSPEKEIKISRRSNENFMFLIY
jgi:hypothetical protein